MIRIEECRTGSVKHFMLGSRGIPFKYCLIAEGVIMKCAVTYTEVVDDMNVSRPTRDHSLEIFLLLIFATC